MKSYVDLRNPTKWPDRDITMYQLWDEARQNGFVGSMLNLETGERMTNLELLNMVGDSVFCCTTYSIKVWAIQILHLLFTFLAKND